MINRRDVLKTAALFTATAALGSTPAGAQAWPTRYLKLVVGAAPGGVFDALARLAGDTLSKTIGVPIVVENKAGAGGSIAMQDVARSAPDGGTMALATISQLVFNSYLFTKLPYAPIRDFRAVAPLAWTSSVLVANPSLPASTLPELIALSNKDPGKLLLGVPLSGAPPHIAGLLLMQQTGLKLTIVPFRSGTDALTATMRGDVQLLIDGPALLAAQAESGAVKPLVVTGPQRFNALKGVPTVIEAGFAGAAVKSWFGFVAPANTPEPVVDSFNAAARAMVRDEDFVRKLDKLSFIPMQSTPKEFASLIADDHRRWSPVLQAAALKLD
jgi:tripartite-type tricarboxylate transporter receptor subunit TctC